MTEIRDRLPDLIGHTPLLDLSDLIAKETPVRLFAKAEWFNPGYSIKDRAAWAIVRAALQSGALTGEKRLLDASSGNTALSYAMLGAALGFRVTLCLPAHVSQMQKNLLAIYGAEVIYTDPLEGSDGAIRTAKSLAKKYPDRYYYADQYSNSANWQAHFDGTAMEIWHQTRGTVTHFVAGLGTCGTFVGCGRRFRQLDKRIRLVAVQPDSPLHGIEGLKHLSTALVPAIYDSTLAEEHVAISTDEAQQWVRVLARSYGLFIGLSAGAALCAALRIARTLKRGTVVTIFPDGGLRYLDQPFWQETKNDFEDTQEAVTQHHSACAPVLSA